EPDACATLREVRSLRATNSGRSTRSRGGYPHTDNSGNRTTSAPSPSARRPKATIFPQFPSKSPTVVSICAIAMRSGRRSVNGEGPAREAIRRSGRPGVGGGPDEGQSRGGRGRERADPAPRRLRGLDAGGSRVGANGEIGERHPDGAAE